jgi:hypothetical protein
MVQAATIWLHSCFLIALIWIAYMNPTVQHQNAWKKTRFAECKKIRQEYCDKHFR